MSMDYRLVRKELLAKARSPDTLEHEDRPDVT